MNHRHVALVRALVVEIDGSPHSGLTPIRSVGLRTVGNLSINMPASENQTAGRLPSHGSSSGRFGANPSPVCRPCSRPRR